MEGGKDIFRARAHSSVAGRGPDEDRGASGTGSEETRSLLFGSLLEKEGFGCATLSLYVTQILE